MFEMSVDVYEEDINFINSPMPTSQDLQEHLAFMLADNKRKTEVSIRNLNAQERKLMEANKIRRSISGSQIQFSRSSEGQAYQSNA